MTNVRTKCRRVMLAVLALSVSIIAGCSAAPVEVLPAQQTDPDAVISQLCLLPNKFLRASTGSARRPSIIGMLSTAGSKSRKPSA